MKHILLILLLTLSVSVYTQTTTTTTTPKWVSSLPTTCNPLLSKDPILQLKGIALYTCVPNESTTGTPNQGTYKRVVVEQNEYKFTGFQVAVDARNNQLTTSDTDTDAIIHSGGDVTVTDLNLSTPMKISSCVGYPPVTPVNASSFKVTKNGNEGIGGVTQDTKYRWCFKGEDKKYQVSYAANTVSQYPGGVVTVPYVADPQPNSDGSINITDFGAKGDGITDNYIYFKGMSIWCAAHNGCTVRIPEGDFYLNPDNLTRRSITLPSNTTIIGAGQAVSDLGGPAGFSRGPTRIRLKANTINPGLAQSIFRIGELTDRVTIRDLELYSDPGVPLTYGIEGFGTNKSSQGFTFDQMIFSNFTRGISLYYIENSDYQFDYLQLTNSRFQLNTEAALYNEIQNSDWNISGVQTVNVIKTNANAADSFYFVRSGAVTITNSFGGSTNLNTPGGSFIRFNNNMGMLTVINSQCENMTKSMDIAINQPGEYSYPIMLINNIFVNPIVIGSSRQITSTGNLYGPDTWVTTSSNVKIASFGDRFCYGGGIIGGRGCTNDGIVANNPTNPFNNKFGGATLLMQTGMADELGGNFPVKGYPTSIGTPLLLSPRTFTQMGALSIDEAPGGSGVYCSTCAQTIPCSAGGNGRWAVRNNSGTWECD